MDVVWPALGAALLLVVGLVCTGWWLVADTRRHRRRTRTAAGTRTTRKLDRPAHLFCGQRHAVTVAELVEKAARQNEGTWLTWPETDPDNTELIRPYAQHLFPTAIVPRVQRLRSGNEELYANEVT